MVSRETIHRKLSSVSLSYWNRWLRWPQFRDTGIFLGLDRSYLCLLTVESIQKETERVVSFLSSDSHPGHPSAFSFSLSRPLFDQGVHQGLILCGVGRPPSACDHLGLRCTTLCHRARDSQLMRKWINLYQLQMSIGTGRGPGYFMRSETGRQKPVSWAGGTYSNLNNGKNG